MRWLTALMHETFHAAQDDGEQLQLGKNDRATSQGPSTISAHDQLQISIPPFSITWVAKSKLDKKPLYCDVPVLVHDV
eukprot:2710159-Amphidinium_carterae.1